MSHSIGTNEKYNYIGQQLLYHIITNITNNLE